jgi:hypothetical protein
VTVVAGMVVAVAAVSGGQLTEGPVMAGNGAAWAEHMRGGAIRLLTRQPGGRTVVRHRWAAPRGARTDRDVWSLAADGRRVAAVVGTCTASSGYMLTPCSARAFAGPFGHIGGPRLPDRVTRSCRGRTHNTVEVAAGGGWTAVLVEHYCPSLGIESAVRRRIEVRGPRARTIPLPRGGGLRLAGDYLTWSDFVGGAVLYDLRRGERVLRLGTRKGWIAGRDVQADGTLALTRMKGEQLCVSTATPAGTERELACRYENDNAPVDEVGGRPRLPLEGRSAEVAISGGRVLSVRHGAELVLQRPGGEPRTIARFTPRSERVGSFGLGPRSATYAVQPYRFSDGVRRRAGRSRVVVERL